MYVCVCIVLCTQLPPCARDAAVLFNVSLEMPLAGSSSSGGSSSIAGSSTGLVGTTVPAGAAPADPQALADALTAAAFAAPWTCLSAEGQMRMFSTVTLSVQLPRGPGDGAVQVSRHRILRLLCLCMHVHIGANC